MKSNHSGAPTYYSIVELTSESQRRCRRRELMALSLCFRQPPRTPHSPRRYYQARTRNQSRGRGSEWSTRSRRREVPKHPPSSSLTRGRKGRSSTRRLPPQHASCRSRATAAKSCNPSSPLAAISVTCFHLLQRKHLRRDFKGNDKNYLDEFSVEQTYDMGYSSFVCTVVRRNNQRRPP